MKSAIVLAAEKGTRMKSALNKVMHPVLNKPIIGHVVNALKASGVKRIVVVVGDDAKSVKDYLQDSVEYAVLQPQLGIGHTLMQTNVFEDLNGDTIVVNGDAPCIQKKTIQRVFEGNRDAACTVLTSTARSKECCGYIITDTQGIMGKNVEAKDCSEEDLKEKKINTGIFCFNNKVLLELLKEIDSRAQRVYDLAGLVNLFDRKSLRVNTVIVDDAGEVMHVNDRVDLAKANAWMKYRVNEAHMRAGVTIIDPMNTYIDVEAIIGEDTVIYPNVHIQGETVIGSNVTILPNSFLRNAVIGNDVTIDSSKIVESGIGNRSTVGPMSHLRNKTEICEDCRIGNFVEFKNSHFGNGSKCAHLTYIGDSDFGKKINVGCGVVTVNYDGKNKFRTTVHDGAFIGSNCNLIAPVTIGENALLAAGSTITDSVDDGDMGIARARQSIKKGFGTSYKNK